MLIMSMVELVWSQIIRMESISISYFWPYTPIMIAIYQFDVVRARVRQSQTCPPPNINKYLNIGQQYL